MKTLKSKSGMFSFSKVNRQLSIRKLHKGRKVYKYKKCIQMSIKIT